MPRWLESMRWLFFSAAVLALAGCAEPLPADKLDYVGVWRNSQVYLLITADGRLEYERVNGNSRVSLSAPIQSIRDDAIEAGIGFWSTKFEIQQPPKRDDNGVWTMIVDGRELTRAEVPGRTRVGDQFR